MYRKALVCEVVGCAQRAVVVQCPLLLDVIGSTRARLHKRALWTKHTFHALSVQTIFDRLTRGLSLHVEGVCGWTGSVHASRAWRLWQLRVCRAQLQAGAHLTAVAERDCAARIRFRLNLTSCCKHPLLA